MGYIIFLVWSLCILRTHQLQSSQTQVLLQLKKHLEYPPQLQIWGDGHGIDFCYLPPSPSLNLTCQNNILTELILVGDKTSPTKTGSFQGNPVQGLTLSQNFSMDSFVTTLVRLTTLRVLKLVSLGLWGPLPDKIKRLTSLECLDLTDNFLYGSVPGKISAMSNLQILALDHNFFNGSVPDGFGAFKNLTLLSLTNNRLHGQIPDLKGISKLQVLNLSMNGFSWGLPDLPKSLVTASLGNNSFSGEIPKRYGQLNHLQYLDVSSNMLRGSPPDALFSLPNISYINLGSNSFSSISIHLRCSGKLSLVDLSNNKLRGGLPPCLNVDTVNRIVIYDGNCFSLSVIQNQHNESYCSDIQELKPSKGKNIGVLVVVIGGCVVLLCLMVYCLVILYTRCCSKGVSGQHLLKKSMETDNNNNNSAASAAFASQVFTSARYVSAADKIDMRGLPPCRSFSLEELKEATNNFDKTAFIGEGSYGKLYRGRLQNGTQVAVRCLPSSKRYSIRNLRLRLDLLSKLRHPHLVCLLGHCIDSGGQDDPRSDRVFLVFEYVSNGNFQARISGNDPAMKLNWSERLAGLIGVAKAVHFLHTGIIPGFFSNRLKSNNILLNEHGVAKLSDYGLYVISGEIDKDKGEGPKKSWHVKSLEDDGYSFGFIILESFAPSVSSRRENFMMNEMGRLSIEEWQKVVDPYVVETCCSQESLSVVISLAKKCISFDGSRPSFEDILWNLQYAAQVQATADAQ